MKNLILAILFAVVGVVTSLGTYYLAKAQIKSRCEAHDYLAKDYYPDAIKKKYVLPAMIVIAVLINVSSVFVFSDIYKMIYMAVLVPFLLDIGVVDLCIRRIPNSSLLAILIAKIAYTVVLCTCFNGNVKEELVSSALGLGVGVLVFWIPKFVGLYMGAGDTKFSAVVGIVLGLSGFLETMIVSGLIMLALLIILKATKKGGAKTKAPMGPSFAVGFIISVLLPFQFFDVMQFI